MSSFSVDWLRLREPVDRAARDSTLLPQIADCRQIVDLGAGTGANLRYLAPLIGGKQEWTLVEHDATLVNAIPECLREWTDSVVNVGDQLFIQSGTFNCRVWIEQLDLAIQWKQLAIPVGALVTASALLDLVSEHWLKQLVKRCAEASAPVWFALTYDGRMQCDPEEPEDEIVRDLFNEHQRTDKGFGPALGPSAAEMTKELLAANGYQTSHTCSDWQLTTDMPDIQHELVRGWYDAVRECSQQKARELTGWFERRRAHIEAGVSTLIVGHTDIVASPTAISSR